jgi:hypothetical protein
MHKEEDEEGEGSPEPADLDEEDVEEVLFSARNRRVLNLRDATATLRCKVRRGGRVEEEKRAEEECGWVDCWRRASRDVGRRRGTE